MTRNPSRSCDTRTAPRGSVGSGASGVGNAYGSATSVTNRMRRRSSRAAPTFCTTTGSARSTPSTIIEIESPRGAASTSRSRPARDSPGTSGSPLVRRPNRPSPTAPPASRNRRPPSRPRRSARRPGGARPVSRGGPSRAQVPRHPRRLGFSGRPICRGRGRARRRARSCTSSSRGAVTRVGTDLLLHGQARQGRRRRDPCRRRRPGSREGAVQSRRDAGAVARARPGAGRCAGRRGGPAPDAPAASPSRPRSRPLGAT